MWWWWPAQTTDMVSALQAQGVRVDYHLYPEEGHGFSAGA